MVKKLACLAALMLAPALPARAAPVYSKDIVPADGTSGQTLTTGAGVKTGHLQNGAVTAPKLGAGAVTGAAIAPGAVGTAALGAGAVTAPKLGPGAVTSPAIAPAAVATPALADGAVTDAKISGVISASKLGAHLHDAADVQSGVLAIGRLPVGTTAGTVAAGDHQHPRARYGRVVVVAESGGDFADPVDAMASIIDATADRPALVKLMPGVYDVGARSLVMKPYVDVEGSGQGTTVVQSSVPMSSSVDAMVFGAAPAEVRDVTLRRSGPNNLVMYTERPVSLTDVTLVQDGGTQAVQYFNAPAKIRRATIQVTNPSYGFGIYLMAAGAGGSEIVDTDVTLVGTGIGVVLYHAHARLDRVNVTLRGGATGGGDAVFLTGFPAGSSVISNSTVIAEGTARAFAVSGTHGYTLRNVIARASGTQGYAVFDYGSGTVPEVRIVDSDLSGTYCAVCNAGTRTLIFNSTVDGTIAPFAANKCVNVVDANLDPVSCN